MPGSSSRPSEPPGHRCRRCEGQLQRGYAHVHTTLLGYLIAGLSYTHLYFTPDGEASESSLALAWGERRVAYRCLGCGAFVITQHRWEGT